MDDDHGITRELRSFTKDPLLGYASQEQHVEQLTAIADHIDEKHRKAMDDSYRDGYQEGKRDGDDEWYEEHESYLEEHGWYQALDADKEVIHADDELFWKADGESAGRVTAIGVGRRAGWVWTLLDGGTVSVGHVTSLLCHKRPTVEDVLLDMHRRLSDVSELYDVDSDELEEEYTRIIAEYAAKLQLVGDAE